MLSIQCRIQEYILSNKKKKFCLGESLQRFFFNLSLHFAQLGKEILIFCCMGLYLHFWRWSNVTVFGRWLCFSDPKCVFSPICNLCPKAFCPFVISIEHRHLVFCYSTDKKFQKGCYQPCNPSLIQMAWVSAFHFFLCVNWVIWELIPFLRQNPFDMVWIWSTWNKNNLINAKILTLKGLKITNRFVD